MHALHAESPTPLTGVVEGQTEHDEYPLGFGVRYHPNAHGIHKLSAITSEVLGHLNLGWLIVAYA